MSKLRKMNAALWASFGALCCLLTVRAWIDNLCDFKSLLMALFFYASAAAGLWFFFDQTMQGK